MKFARKIFNKIKNALNRDTNARLDTLGLLLGKTLSNQNKNLIWGGENRYI